MTEHIAQFNWGTLKADWDAPEVDEFVQAIDRVNALAEKSPGFVWRLANDEMEEQQIGVASSIDWADKTRVASTLSVWESGQALKTFVFSGVHGSFYRRGAEWFERSDFPRLVLWRIRPGVRPTVTDGVERLKHLAKNGASEFAFGWTDLKVASAF